SGWSVSSAGDVNGDGIDDIIISARNADPNGSESGESYVIFGSNTGFGSSLELSSLDGSNGFVLNGIAENDFSGWSVSSAGDVNGDGIDDIIIGARNADPNGSGSGESYVIFGNNTGFGSSLELSSLDGSNGFVLNGIDSSDFSGWSVSSAGDVNGDGIDDIIIGARNADPNGSESGESYVVFGHNTGFGSSLELSSLDGNNGFVLNGINADDWSGFSVSSAGDVNGDGIDDLIIGARLADPNGQNDAGESYVVFGRANFNSIIDSTPTGDNNLNGTSSGDRIDSGAGHDIARGGAGNDDVNGDNGKDRLFGDAGIDEIDGGNDDDFLKGGDDADNIFGGNGDDVLLGDAGNDTLLGGAGIDSLNGGAGDDLLDGGTNSDRMIGGADADIFVVRPGDTGNIIYDFEDGIDLISLAAGLTFADLTITNNLLETGSEIRQTSTSDLLVTLIGIDETNITSTDFV
ncbi:MAG: hypothetical protein AAGA80_26235, partial [Cyanobacteria bacterium P01_F01_bin.143]